MNAINHVFSNIDEQEVRDIARIRNIVLKTLQDFAQKEGFSQFMPILMSPITDPLNHAVYPAEISYQGTPLRLTASMIFHKQLLLSRGGLEKVFIVAPNIRLEKPELKPSYNHLLEFSQFDIEMKNASMNDVMSFLNDLLRHLFDTINLEASDELARLGRTLKRYNPFPVFSSHDLAHEFGDDFERIISERSETPVFVTSFKREFYDREDPSRPGTYRNFDLIYPEGFGEALSGAEREYDYARINERMKETGVSVEPFRHYLEIAKQGQLAKTAGAGIGIERLLRFITGRRHIRDVSPFDRSVGTEFIF